MQAQQAMTAVQELTAAEIWVAATLVATSAEISAFNLHQFF
jgi:hypothetical protein